MKDMKERFDKILYSKTPDFNEEEHKYAKEGKTYQSVTNFISEFFPKFDQERIAELSANKRTRETGEETTKEQILKEWTDIRDNGTLVHKVIEEAILNNSYNPDLYVGATKQGLQALKGLQLIHDYVLFYPELMIYDEELGLAGTIDLVAITRSGEVHLIDWKTNTKIRKENKFESGSHELTNTLHNSNYNKYMLQLNVYKKFINNLGLSVSGMFIPHIRPNYYEIYRIKENDELVNNMLEVKNG